MTEGEFRVGIAFNVANSGDVDYIKTASAALIDMILTAGGDERSANIAASKFEEAAMWAVKSVTKPKRKGD